MGIGITREDASEIVGKVEMLAQGIISTAESESVHGTVHGSIIQPIGDYAYGASLIPDEDEIKTTPVRYGTVADPDGHAVELKESGGGASTAAVKIVLNVAEFDDTISFYTEVLGMQLLRRRSDVNSKPKRAALVAYLVRLFLPHYYTVL